MLALCTIILAAAALSLAESIFTPVAFSLFGMAIVWPLQKALQARMPKLFALLLTLVLTLVVLGLLALAIAWGSSQVGQWLLSNLDRFQYIYLQAGEWLKGHGIFATAMLADRFDVS
jgi:predicted PurR-regulated permease PerM